MKYKGIAFDALGFRRERYVYANDFDDAEYQLMQEVERADFTVIFLALFVISEVS